MLIRFGARGVTGRIGPAIAQLSLLLCVAVPAAAQTPLTLAEAQRIAVARSHALSGQDAAAAAAREMETAAGQLPDPVATVGINNLPINGPDAWSSRDSMTMASVGLMQEFTRGEKREARAERYQREAEKALADKAAKSATILRDTALAWLDRYYAEMMLGIVAEQEAQARAEIDAAQSAYRAGRGNLADVLGARSTLVGLDDRASEMRRRVVNAKIALARWVGATADAPLASPPPADSVRLDPRTLDDDVTREPQLQALSRQEAMAAADVRAAEANKKPDWSLSLMYSQRGPAYSNMISVNLSVPLQWDQGNRQDRELAAKLALLNQARAERQDMQRARAAELHMMIAEWENDRERSLRYERELVPLAAERTEATLAAYRGAKATLAEVLLSRGNEIDVRLQAVQLQMDAARLWAQLNFLFPEDSAGQLPISTRKEAQ